jgi:ribonucleases P/MRP protein subunit RPP40
LSKCKSLNVGPVKDHHPFSYFVGPHMLDPSSLERDLGVMMDSNLSFDSHIATVINKANRVLGLLKRNFRHLDAHCLLLLYKAMVRSILEYAQPVWSPHLKKHITAIEKVQQRATRILPSLRNLPYAQRLKSLKLPSLVYRRLRGDMIEAYKILHDYYDPSCVPSLQIATINNTRGHSFKLYKPSVCSGPRARSFACRIVNPWNSLPDSVVTAPTINSFKNRLDDHWANLDIRFNYKGDSFFH